MLSTANFIHIRKDEVVIDWYTLPKGRRAMPFSTSRWTVIKGDLTSPICSLLSFLLPFPRLTTWTTSKLVSVWNAIPRMKSFSAHSIKRGAMAVVFQKVAAGADVPEILVSRLAKHSVKAGLSNVTLRYGGDSVAMARALATDRVTVLL
ncbi:hypothetical protein DIPPA_29909 [Diplonema papillatum]|nr:hypothetical protein DIPPA_02292 [Diplonema papillatum]KAJ9439750.1 hypothetical protein DIPPA_29917 [Diplonema papillatum]KAJ9440464.1 hypothetical protein DIPPA_22682 [Diplonema papillatum]KAJ9459290.1 hypothetical protein DIPPA_29909 [Diplonema papillatum]